MKIETVLNAMMYARDRASGVYREKRTRQYWRFRKWLIVRDCRLERKIQHQQIEIENLKHQLYEVTVGVDL